MENGKRLLYDRECSVCRSGLTADSLLDPTGCRGTIMVFPLYAETATDGWAYGAITAFEGVKPSNRRRWHVHRS